MIEQNSRRTKIIKSFEGKALTREEAQEVSKQDADVLRLVYDEKFVPAISEFIRTLKDAGKAAKGNKNRAYKPVILDLASYTQGICADLKEPREVKFGDRIIMAPKGGTDVIGVRGDSWARLWAEDAKVFIGSGNVGLRTVSVRSDKVELEVTQGGTIYPEMEIFVPATRRLGDERRFSPAKVRDLIREGVDYLIIPGTWTIGAIGELKATLAADHGDAAPWLFIKVDSGEVYERLQELIEGVDGVLISRREMALTLSPTTVPMITKEIIQLCNDRAKVVLTASEMLASMRRNVTPTRAEVSDVANAVIDGTDAVMLSEEVANGRYGDKAVEVMSRIICDIETRASNVALNWTKHVPEVANEMDAIAYHALRTAERLKAKAIVTITKAGNTALKLASFRAPVPVIAVTFSDAVVRRLSIVRGVETLRVDIDPNLDEVLPLVNDELVRGSWLRPGDPIIFVAITLSPVGRESSNLFTVQTLT